ncbi:MAG: outer membrane receptor for ferrienterochelin and colicins, partial [Maribacter sp.]
MYEFFCSPFILLSMKYLIFIIIFSISMVHLAFTQEDLDSLELAWDVIMEDVVVTGQYTPTDYRNVLHEIKVIKKEEIELKGATNLEELLMQETGIRISQDVILGSSMSLQGLSGENIKIMIDGVPVLGRLGGNIDLSQISMDNVERVEIVEGPMAVNYGTDALAGVINIITKKSQKNNYQATINSAYESIGTQDYSANIGIRTKNNLIIKFNGGWEYFDGILDSLDVNGNEPRDLLWNPKEQWNANALVSYRINEQHKLAFSLNYFNEIIKNDGEMRRPEYRPYAFDDTYKTKRFNLYLTYDAEFKKGLYLQTLVSCNQYTRHKNSYRTEFSADTIFNEDGSFDLTFFEDSSTFIQPINVGEFTIDDQDTSKFNQVLSRSTLAYEFDKIPLSIQGGLDFSYDNAIGKRIFDEDESKPNFSQLGDYGIFTKLRYDPILNLSIEGGIRYAYNTKYNAPIIPSLHLKYNLGKSLIFRVSCGKGFRAPSLKELYFNFIDSNHYIIGNRELSAENSNNIQGSIHYTWKKKEQLINLKTKVFYNSIKDRISLYEFEPDTENPSPELEFTYFNQDIYKTIGSQINLGYDYKNYHFTSSFASTGFYNPLNETVRSIRTYSHSIETALGASYSHSKHGFHAGLFFKYNDRLINFSPSVDEEGNDIIIQNILKGYSMIDFNASKSFWKKRMTLSFGIRNLLDTRAVDRVGNSSSGHGMVGTQSVVSV